MVLHASAIRPRRRVGRYLALTAALAGVIAAVFLIVTSALNDGKPVPDARSHRSAGRPSHAAVRRLPPYWTVRPGDTYGEIAAKTGLTVAQLEAFNPGVGALALQPGQRLNLWRQPPKPRPKPLGPLFWTVRPGESFGSISDKTGINIITLEQLNPQLKPATLQPGDRVRLRR